MGLRDHSRYSLVCSGAHSLDVRAVLRRGRIYDEHTKFPNLFDSKKLIRTTFAVYQLQEKNHHEWSWYVIRWRSFLWYGCEEC